MDGFKSIIFRTTEVDVNGDLLFGFLPAESTSLASAEMDTDEIYVDVAGYGWNGGGLLRTLYASDRGFPSRLRDPRAPLYFRGHALFDNIDDAKNDYLMEPETDMMDKNDNECEAHVPFGMVIPDWTSGTLGAVTILLFWQELS